MSKHERVTLEVGEGRAGAHKLEPGRTYRYQRPGLPFWSNVGDEPAWACFLAHVPPLRVVAAAESDEQPPAGADDAEGWVEFVVSAPLELVLLRRARRGG